MADYTFPAIEDELRRRRTRISSNVSDLHPYVRETYLQSRGAAFPNYAAAKRASAEQFRMSEADARVNKLLYERSTGNIAPPGYGYISPEHMPEEERKAARTYWGALAAPPVSGAMQTINLPSGGTVSLPATTDPTRLAMRRTAAGVGALPDQALRPEFAREVGFTGVPTSLLQTPTEQLTPFERLYRTGFAPREGGVSFPSQPDQFGGFQAGQRLAAAFQSIPSVARNVAQFFRRKGQDVANIYYP